MAATGPDQFFDTNAIYTQGGGTPIDSVLRAATAVKILTDKNFIIALH